MSGFTGGPPLRLSSDQVRRIVAHCYDGLPDEACGILAGPITGAGPTGFVGEVYPCRNADLSARTFTVDSRDMLRAMREAEGLGYEIVGVWHSHTHTHAYPSLTDVRQAPDASWYYVLVSLEGGDPVVRAYRIRDERVDEAPVTVVG